MQLITLILSQVFLKICDDYRVPNDPMKYWDEKFYWTYQHSVHWPDDYIGPDSMTRWITEGSVGFTEMGQNIAKCQCLCIFNFNPIQYGMGGHYAPLVTSLFLEVEGQNLVAWGILMCLLQKWH